LSHYLGTLICAPPLPEPTSEPFHHTILKVAENLS